MRAVAGAVAGLAVAFVLACSPGQTPAERQAALDRRAREVAVRAAAADSAAESGHPSDAPIALWILPYHYSEISGLTLTSDGRLLALGDENSEIWEIDYRRGVITSRFTVGDPAIQADFEGLVAVDHQLYLMDSKGRIYRTTEGADRSTVPAFPGSRTSCSTATHPSAGSASRPTSTCGTTPTSPWGVTVEVSLPITSSFTRWTSAPDRPA